MAENRGIVIIQLELTKLNDPLKILNLPHGPIPLESKAMLDEYLKELIPALEKTILEADIDYQASTKDFTNATLAEKFEKLIKQLNYIFYNKDPMFNGLDNQFGPILKQITNFQWREWDEKILPVFKEANIEMSFVSRLISK